MSAAAAGVRARGAAVGEATEDAEAAGVEAAEAAGAVVDAPVCSGSRDGAQQALAMTVLVSRILEWRALMIEEVADGVFTSDHRVVEGKNGIVFGARGVLAIDAGTDAAEGQVMADFIARRGRRANRLALTHSHGDHALGSGAFRGGDVYAHATAPDNLRVQLERRAASEGGAPWQTRVAWPTVTFESALRLDLGNRRVRMFSTPGHSEDSACLYLEEARVLFGGDTVVTAIPLAFSSGDSRSLEASLRRLGELEIDLLVGGHGPVVRGAARVRAHLTWLVEYLVACRAAVTAALARSKMGAIETVVDTALEDASYERVIGSRLDPERYGNHDRHRAALHKIVAEETVKARSGA